MLPGDAGQRQRRFEKAIEVVLKSRQKGILLFRGEAQGVNDNGFGANVRGYPEVPPPAVGDVYRVEFVVPADLGEIPPARVVRIEAPRGDPHAERWEVFLALRFETGFDSGALFAAAMPRRPGEPPVTSLDALRRSTRRRPPGG